MTPFPLIRACGEPFTLGEAYGVAARELVRLAVGVYGDLFRRAGRSPEGLDRLAAAVLERISSLAPASADEMRGIASGAGVELRDVVLLNARSEVLGDPPGHCECTSIAVSPGSSATGRPMLAQTWDWLPVTVGLPLLLDARPSGGIPFLSFCEAGQVAKVGLNAAGLAVGLNFIISPESEREQARAGLPIHVLAREVLCEPDVRGAIGRLRSIPRGGAANFVLADRSGAVACVEITPSTVRILEPKAGIITHANSFEGSDGRRPPPAPPYRSRRARDLLLRKAGRIDRAALLDVLRDHEARAGVICSHGVPGAEASVTASLAALVIEPAGDPEAPAPALWVSRGPPCQHEPVRVPLGAGPRDGGRPELTA